MKPNDLADPGYGEGMAAMRSDADPRVSAAVQEAYNAPCPEFMADRILARVRDEESAVHAWQAPWVLALPAAELALLMLLRSEMGSLLGLCGRLWSTVRDAALPSWQGGIDSVRFWWLTVRTWLSNGLPPQQDLLPWAAAVLLAAALAGTLILRQERARA